MDPVVCYSKPKNPPNEIIFSLLYKQSNKVASICSPFQHRKLFFQFVQLSVKNINLDIILDTIEKISAKSLIQGHRHAFLGKRNRKHLPT